jgi:lipoprotein-anchoring transpeptidase ErfK/SrfK
MYEWNDDNGPGDLKIEIDLSKQVATYKRQDRVIGWSFVCTGKNGHSTRTGDYKITEKMPLKYSSRYGWISNELGEVSNGDASPSSPVPPGETYRPSPMKEWMRITHYGVGLHAGDIPKIGVPASHGCIRIPREFATILYASTKVGTSVKIIDGLNSSHKLKPPQA